MDVDGRLVSGGAQGLILRQLTNPALTNVVLKTLGGRGRTFYPQFRNTVSPGLILQVSTKVNVIPSEISVELDGRLLPGQTPEDMSDARIARHCRQRWNWNYFNSSRDPLNQICHLYQTG
ncbi:MAG: hypothetical protein IPJ47_07205 [Anaerolineales bacterium]|nr:hypothetical protein [Anaerolineales bacterium]